MKSTSPDGEVKVFKTIHEAPKELGFSERGMGTAYHTGRNRIGEYELEWLEIIPEPESEIEKKTTSRKQVRTETGELKGKIKERMDKFKEENINGKKCP